MLMTFAPSSSTSNNKSFKLFFAIFCELNSIFNDYQQKSSSTSCRFSTAYYFFVEKIVVKRIGYFRSTFFLSFSFEMPIFVCQRSKMFEYYSEKLSYISFPKSTISENDVFLVFLLDSISLS